ncbi:MAG TPA: hypothetical protein VH518_06590 [Tepidisphaeraceae bacterium]|jgi:hypothetical protein
MYRVLSVALVILCIFTASLIAGEKQSVSRTSWTAGPLSLAPISPVKGSAPIGAEVSATFAPFNASVSDTPTATVLSTGAVPAGAYNYVTISTNWQAGAGDPFSSEAFFALATGTDPNSAAPIYKFLTPFSNGSDDGVSRTLNYTGFLYRAYSGGAPLSMFAQQVFSGSNANWNNVSITIESRALPAVPFVNATQAGSLTGTLTAGEVDWYKFAYNGAALTIDTEGSTLSPDNDTIIALYNGSGGLEAISDDDGTGLLSLLDIPAGALPAGDYYLAVLAFDDAGNSFDDGLVATSGSTNVGGYVINGLSVPEPAGVIPLILLQFSAWRRRRRHLRR